MKNSENILKNAIKLLSDKTGLSPVMSAEIEFYLNGTNEQQNNCLALIMLGCKKQNIELETISNETGDGQKEISLKTHENPLKLAQNIVNLKKITKDSAENMGLYADMTPLPLENQPSNGLHIHISLIDKNGVNLFAKERGVEDETEYMQYAIGGLCEIMAESMIYFAPTEDSYKRYRAKYHDITENSATYNYAPTNISWGANNRTTAIRIPTSTLMPENRHIEHRVPSINSDPYMAIAAIISGIIYGTENKITPPEKIYGNAFDKQYELQPLPKSLKDAKKPHDKGKIIKPLFSQQT